MENENRTRDMTTGNPTKLIVEFAIPIVLSNIFQQCYTITDSAIIGRGVGSTALAAVGATDWLNWTMSGTVIAFTTGFSVLVAQNFGAKDENNLRKTISMILFLSICIVVIFTVGSIFFIEDILRLLHTSEDIFDYAYSYISIIYKGTFAVMAFNAMAAILRALGDGKTPLKAQILAAVINIVLDVIFIYRFHLEVVGAAVATVIAQLFAAVYCFYIIRKQKFLFPQKNEWHIDIDIIRKLLTLGMPLAAKNLLVAVGGIIMQAVVNTYSMEVVAGYTTTNKLYGCITIASVSFGHAFSSYTGQNYGAHNKDRMRAGFKSILWISVVTSVLISIVLVVFGNNIVSIFLESDDMHAQLINSIAVRYLYRFAVFIIFLYIEAVLSALLQGIGITNISFGVGMIGLLTRIALVEVLPVYMGVTGLFYPEPVAWATEGLVIIVYCIWKFKKEVYNYNQERKNLIKRRKSQ